MNYHIADITDSDIWESSVQRMNKEAYFQAWEWGIIERKQGNKVWRIGIYQDAKNKLDGVSQITKICARRGTFLHVRHGPIFFDWSNREIWNVWISWMLNLAKKEQARFIRMSPLIQPNMQAYIASLGFQPAPIHSMDAEVVSIIDISKPEDVLLQSMRKTTRNLIRRSTRDGVIVSRSTDICEFLNMYRTTAIRHDFIPHTAIEREYELFTRNDMVDLLYAKHDNQLLATAMIVYFGGQGIYRHGASVPSKIPAAYALQWDAIVRTKKRGLLEYNLYGIADTDRISHPWRGLTDFKKGFGGETRRFLHAHDMPLTSLYWLTYAIESVRRLWRRY